MKKFLIALVVPLLVSSIVHAKIPGDSHIIPDSISSASIVNTYCPSVVSVSLDPTLIDTNPAYVALAGDATFSYNESFMDKFLVPVTMNAHSLYVKLDGSNSGITDRYQIVLRDDTADTLLVCGISGTGVDRCQDDTNVVSLAAGSRLTVSITTTGDGNEPVDVSEALISFCLTQ